MLLLQVYAHAAEQEERDAAERLERWLSREGVTSHSSLQLCA